MPRPDWCLPPDPAGWVETPERCAILEVHNHPASPGASIARARVRPGVTTQLHALRGVQEVYVIEAGAGVAEVGGTAVPVGPGDRVVIAPDIAQRIHNTGTEDLLFLCLCTPRFRPEIYVNLETAGSPGPLAL